MESRSVTSGSPSVPANVSPLFQRELDFYGRTVQTAMEFMSYRTIQITLFAVKIIGALITLAGSSYIGYLAYRALPVYFSGPAIAALALAVNSLFGFVSEKLEDFHIEAMLLNHENQWIEFFGGLEEARKLPVHEHQNDVDETEFLEASQAEVNFEKGPIVIDKGDLRIYFSCVKKGDMDGAQPPAIFELYYLDDAWIASYSASNSPFFPGFRSIKDRMTEVLELRVGTHATFKLAQQHKG